VRTALVTRFSARGNSDARRNACQEVSAQVYEFWLSPAAATQVRTRGFRDSLGTLAGPQYKNKVYGYAERRYLQSVHCISARPCYAMLLLRVGIEDRRRTQQTRGRLAAGSDGWAVANRCCMMSPNFEYRHDQGYIGFHFLCAVGRRSVRYRAEGPPEKPARHRPLGGLHAHGIGRF